MNINNAKFTMACGTAKQLPKSDLPEVVFSGRSNVGKSSLINKIVNRKAMARVSATPGKTATINFFNVDTFNLVDLPGYGYAKVSHAEKQRWADLMEGYFADNRNFALVIQICDMRHKPTQADIDMINFLIDAELPMIIVLTKKDKLNKTEQAKQLALYNEILNGETEVFPFSALNGDGTEEIRAAIERYVEEASRNAD